MNNHFYQIAGHTFRLSFPAILFDTEDLSNYEPFRVEGVQEYLFHLSVTDQLPAEIIYEQIGQFDDDIASIGIFKAKDGDYRFQISYPGSKDYCMMDTDSAFRKARVILSSNKQFQFFYINNCLMLLYAFSSANFDTLLMHASVIKNNGEGFLFLGKSGTGKSTHSRLWMKHVEGSELLNDDNPIVRIIDGKTIVFGSPWSGKTPCYHNESIPLKGIVRLQQAPENKIKKLSVIQAYASILPTCSCMRWEEDMMEGVHHTVEKLATSIGCFLLDCLPNKMAAQLCSTTIRQIK